MIGKYSEVGGRQSFFGGRWSEVGGRSSEVGGRRSFEMAGFGNIMNRSNPGERYLMGDLMGPDGRFCDDVATVEGGIRYLIQCNPDSPFLREKTDKYDQYRSNLGWYECYIKPNETFDELMQHYHECLRASGSGLRTPSHPFGCSSATGVPQRPAPGVQSSEVGGRISEFAGAYDDSDTSTLSSIENVLKRAGGFIINRSVSGNYYKGTPWGPDGRFVDDLKKIDDYVRTHSRPRIAQYPKSLSAVEEYERWRQSFSMGSSETDFYPDETMNTAKAKLAAIRSAQGEGLAPTDVAPSDNTDVLSPQFVSSPKDSTTTTEKMKMFGKVVAGVAGVILILLGVRAVKRGAGRIVIDSVKSAGSSIASGVSKILPSKKEPT